METDSETHAVLAVLKVFCSLERLTRIGVHCRIRCRRAIRSARLPAWVDRPSSRAFAVSLLIHLGLAVCAAVSLLPSGVQFREIVFETGWVTPEDSSAKFVEFSAGEFAATPPASDGGSVGGFLPEFRTAEPDVPNPTQTALASLTWNAAAETDLSRAVGSPVNRVGAGMGRGQGQGVGNGKGHGREGGDGKSFFGMGLDGKSFVYVLDCSLSMNHPHDSDAKTRFRKMKMELANSVSHLRPDQEFFIVFFNHEAVPMPAERMVSAAPENKQYFLDWVEQVPAQGDTDPTAALLMALRMRPDVIYFLTDGCFSGAANDIVKGVQQSRTTIHTFVFETWLTEKQQAGLELMRQKKVSAAMAKLGEATYRRLREILVAEQVMQGLSQNNGGKYHVIP
ncbi:MAG: VWA domain-containing protein [Planctomycetes bacterium]|nr:VWA domain-containing protein [Planctomycetota bacterium]